VALGLDLGFLKTVNLGMLVGPVLLDQGYLSFNLGLGLAWVLVPAQLFLVSCFFDLLVFWSFAFL